MKTQFKFRNGAVRTINEKAAKLLQRAGKGTYQTRDMVADRDEASAIEADAYIKAENARIVAEQQASEVEQVADDGLDAMDRDQLLALAKERGVEVHHRSGADKIRAALRGE